VGSLSSSSFSYRQLALVDLRVIPRNLTRTSPRRRFAGCLFFPFRPIAVVNYKHVITLVNKMVDWTKYPLHATRVSPALKEDINIAADKSGLTVPDWTRRVLLSASSSEAEPVASLLTNTETDQKEDVA